MTVLKYQSDYDEYFKAKRARKIMSNATISFTVEIEYTTENDKPIDPVSMLDHLYASIEHERVNGSLTPTEVAADYISVSLDDL